MSEIMTGEPRLADVIREGEGLADHNLNHVFDEYQQAYWYAAGRLDERGSRSAHSVPHAFAVQRAFDRLHLIRGKSSFLSNLEDAWGKFDADAGESTPAPVAKE